MIDLAIDKLRSTKILVIGDVMLDRYWWGSVERISPEAPVPVVVLENVTHVAGGAANVAANIEGLGCDPFLIGISGNDVEADLLMGSFADAGIERSRLFRIDGRKTTVKNRVVAHNQHMLRFDQETTAPLTDGELDPITSELVSSILDSDLVILSDYGKGFLTETVVTRLIATARDNNKAIVVDPKGRDYSKYRGATVITPNQKEAEEACGLPLSDETVDSAGEKLIQDLELQGVVITRGEKGMRVYEQQRSPVDLSATARMVYNVTGAGDTVIAVLAVGLASGLSLIDAAGIANFAAGIVVEDVGTTAITLSRLHDGHTRHTAP
jgi:D-beta-D-heptose 7-phosphate kinase / D-beta-D-heptose 1-phosphate adenosyltransferase